MVTNHPVAVTKPQVVDIKPQEANTRVPAAVIKPQVADTYQYNDRRVADTNLLRIQTGGGISRQRFQPGGYRFSPGSGYQTPGSGYSSPGGGYQTPGGGYQSPGSGYQSPGGYIKPQVAVIRVPAADVQTPGGITSIQVVDIKHPDVYQVAVDTRLQAAVGLPVRLPNTRWPYQTPRQRLSNARWRIHFTRRWISNTRSISKPWWRLPKSQVAVIKLRQWL